MKCPNCHHGFIFGLNASVTCPICKGTRELPENITYDPDRGLKKKIVRMEADYTLRRWCKESGEDAVIRSEQERGFFRK
jgi:hypothetical protein